MSPCAPILLTQSLIPHAWELTQHIQYQENPTRSSLSGINSWQLVY